MFAFPPGGTAPVGQARVAQPAASASAALTPTPTAEQTTSSAQSASPGAAAVPVVTPTMVAASHPVPVTTPAAKTGESASHVSGSIQCQVGGVEGIWIQAANGGSGWAPWVSSAARPSYATYSYTLPYGGPYSAEIGCGGTSSTWGVVEYTGFHDGTVNNFYCYDQRGSSLCAYCS